MLDLIMPAGRKYLAAFGGRDSEGWGRTWFSTNRVRTNAGVTVDEELALTYVAVFTCSRIISESVSSLPLFCYKRKETGDRSLTADISASELISLAPNPLMTAMPFRDGRTLHQLNWGQGFAEIVRDPRTGEISELWPIHPGRVRPALPRTSENYKYIVRNNDGSAIGMHADEMLHLCGTLSDDGVWGRSIIQYARESIGFGMGLERHGASFFGTGAQPKGLLVTPGLRQREDKRAFRQEWKEMHGSPESSEIAILPPGSSYSPISISNEDNQFLATREYSRDDVCNWYRVPQFMLSLDVPRGDPESFSAQFIVFTLYPWVRRQEEQYNLKLLSDAERKVYYFEHLFQGMLRGNQETRMNSYRVALSMGLMSINECRRIENMNSIGPAGDQYYVPANMVTAQQMAEGKGGQRSGPGSDHTGAPADNPLDHEPAMRNLLESMSRLDPAKFAEWQKTLPKLQREDMSQQIKDMQSQMECYKSDWREAAREVLEDALGRMLTKESQAAQRAAAPGSSKEWDRWVQEFYAKHETTVADAVRPACRTLKLAGIEKRPEDLAAWMRARSVEALERSYNSDSREVFQRKLAAWPTERAKAVAAEILQAAA